MHYDIVYLFDLTGVVISGGEPNTSAFHADTFAKAFGTTPDILKTAWFAPWGRFKLGQCKEPEFWREYLTGAGVVRPDVKAAAALYRELCGEVPGTKEILKGLKAGGARLAALTNTSHEWLKYWGEQFGLNYYFSPLIASCEVGLAKPEPAFFEYALRTLGVKASDVVFIDNQENHVLAARAFGIKSVLFTSAEQLKSYLNSKSQITNLK